MVRHGVLLVALLTVLGAGACTPPPGAVTPIGGGGPAVSPPPVEAWEDPMLARINAERSAVGAGPVAGCGTLRIAAIGHSFDQAGHNLMTHTGSDGSDLRVRVERVGYVGWTGLGENVAAGYGSVDGVMGGLMSSTSHRANLLNPSFTHVGLGRIVSGAGVPYWTQDFGLSGVC